MDRRTFLAIAGVSLAACATRSLPLSLEDITQGVIRLRPVLRQLAERSFTDNIEEGGVLVQNGRYAFYRIENDVQRDEERYRRFAEGDDAMYAHLSNHATVAAALAAENAPEAATGLLGQGIILQQVLSQMRVCPAGYRKFLGEQHWHLYDAFVRRNIYLCDQEEYAAIERRHQGTITHKVHVHPGGSPPSRVDLDLSRRQPQLVIAYAPQKYAVYELRAGEQRVLDTETRA